MAEEEPRLLAILYRLPNWYTECRDETLRVQLDEAPPIETLRFTFPDQVLETHFRLQNCTRIFDEIDERLAQLVANCTWMATGEHLLRAAGEATQCLERFAHVPRVIWRQHIEIPFCLRALLEFRCDRAVPIDEARVRHFEVWLLHLLHFLNFFLI